MDENLARLFGVPTEAEKAASTAAHEAFMRSIFAETAPDTSAAEFLRGVVEGVWHVPVDESGNFQIAEAKAGKYRLAIPPAAESGGKLRPRKGGEGGRLLPLFAAEKADARRRHCTGLELTASLPADIDGLLVRGAQGSGVELRSEFFPALREVAAAYKLEEVLAKPGLGQIETLLESTWFSRIAEGRIPGESRFAKGNLAHVFTHPDRMPREKSLTPITGRRLFEMLAADASLDGFHINQGHYLGSGTPRVANLLLSPGFACQILEGRDIRPYAQPFPARSIKEVELWLELHRFPLWGREMVEAAYAETHLVRALVRKAADHWWLPYEREGDIPTQRGDLWSPVFALDAKTPEEAPSQILCAGLLAQRLNAGSVRGKNPERYWKPGRFCLAGRWLCERDRRDSLARLAFARELYKLLSPGENRIPRRAILTVEGAAILRKYPHGGSREWIEATIRQAEKYSKPWVWG